MYLGNGELLWQIIGISIHLLASSSRPAYNLQHLLDPFRPVRYHSNKGGLYSNVQIAIQVFFFFIKKEIKTHSARLTVAL